MFYLNKITLIGHLGKDPEVKTLPSGHLVVTIKLATSEVYKDKEGKWQQQTEWHTLILWNKLAEFASQHFIKGEKLYAEGKLKYREFIVPEQGRKKVAEIQVEKIFSLEKKKAENTTMESNQNEMPDLPW